MAERKDVAKKRRRKFWSNPSGEVVQKPPGSALPLCSEEKVHKPPMVRWKVMKDDYGQRVLVEAWTIRCTQGLYKERTKTDRHWKEDVGEGGYISLWERMCIGVRDPMGTSPMRSLRRALVDGKKKSKDLGNDHPKQVDEKMTEMETSIVSSKKPGSWSCLWTQARNVVGNPLHLLSPPRGRKRSDDLENVLLSSLSSSASRIYDFDEKKVCEGDFLTRPAPIHTPLSNINNGLTEQTDGLASFRI